MQMRFGLLTTILTAALLAAFATKSASQTEAPPRPQTGPANATLNDGPYLFHSADGKVLAKWVRAGKVHEKQFAKGEAIRLPQFAELLGESLTLTPHKPDASIWPMPGKLLALSDVEGEYDIMRRFLAANGVIDKAGKWAFGKGHVVCIGDMVDRGTKVTETLWILYRLDKEAQKAGGRLHYVLGNHEVMMMGGDVRYTALKYKAVAALFGIPCEQLVGADQEIGRWLRSHNVLERIGPYLFVHAGVSPPVAAEKVDYSLLNRAFRSILGVPPLKISNLRMQALSWGPLGPLWYRGYFKEWKLSFGPVPTKKQFAEILTNLGAKTIVIGHTKVPKITPMHRGAVLAIDIPWTSAANVRGIIVENGKLQVIDVEGKRTDLKN